MLKRHILFKISMVLLTAIFTVQSVFCGVESPSVVHKTLAAWSNACFKKFDESAERGRPQLEKTCLPVDDLVSTADSCVDLYKNWVTSDDAWFSEKALDPVKIDNWDFDSKDKEKSKTPLYPHVQKLIVPIDSTVCLIGDLHGSIHSLLRNLWRLVALNYLNNDFSIKKENFYMIFTGDLVDRGRFGVEVVYTLMRLKLANPDHVFLVRGNHEEPGVYCGFDFKKEFNKKYSGHEKRFNSIRKFFELLPYALYLGSGAEENPEFVQCCHGGIETGYNPRQFLASDKNFDVINEEVDQDVDNHVTPWRFIDSKTRLNKQDQNWVEARLADMNYKENNYAGFNWSDFAQPELLQDRRFLGRGQYAEICDAKMYKNRAKRGVGYLAGILAVKDFLRKTGLRAFFRGHQDMRFGFKMFFSRQQESKKIPESHKEPEYPMGPYHWVDVLGKQHGSNESFSLRGMFPVFTLTSAAEGQSVPFDCFVLLTTKEKYDNWVVQPYEIPLSDDRDEQFVRLGSAAKGSFDPIDVEWVSDKESAGVDSDLVF